LCYGPQRIKSAGTYKKRVLAVDPHAGIILFGSRARADSGKDSDWDILILIEKDPVNRISEQMYREVIFNIELEKVNHFDFCIFKKRLGKPPCYNSII